MDKLFLERAQLQIMELIAWRI